MTDNTASATKPIRHMPFARLVLCGGVIAALLAGCAHGPVSPLASRDGAPGNPPAGLDRVADAEPRIEPIRSSGGTSKPYTVLGRSYSPITDDRPWREAGLASWYGSGFHAQSTASGEPYDMYAMTAAHKTLPLPSYARVRNPANGREVIVRVNDRGPFHEGRVIDLSYTAALRLDLLRGVAPVEVERITNEDIRTGVWRRDNPTRLATAGPAGATPAPRGGTVAVPAAWATPVASQAGVPRAAGTLVAQATPLPTESEATTATDVAPPPRFRGMEVSDLPAMAPVPPPPAAAPRPPGAETGALPVAPRTSAPAAASANPPSAAGPGFWVQLGAFREREGAADLQGRTARALPALASQLRVYSEAGTHRLQAGPFGSREAANDTATQLRNGLQLVPIVVERR